MRMTPRIRGGAAKKRKPNPNHRWRIDVDDYGMADVAVITGDLDGSGEAPGVQLEFEHVGTGGRQALAMSGREAGLLSRALAQASARILPHQNLMARRRKWHYEATGEDTRIGQPVAERVDEVLTLTAEEADELVDMVTRSEWTRTPFMQRILDELEVPF